MADLATIRLHITRLETIYRLPAERDAVIGAWLAVLGDATADELAAAVERYTKTDSEWWPKPGQLLAFIESDRRGRGYWRSDDSGEPIDWPRLKSMLAKQGVSPPGER